MSKIDCRTTEMIDHCRRLHRLAREETVFAALSTIGLVPIFFIMCMYSTTGISMSAIISGLCLLLSSMVVLPAAIAGLMAFDHDGRFYSRGKAELHMWAAICAVLVGILEESLLYYPLKMLSASNYLEEDLAVRLFRVLAWSEAFLILAYVICFVTSIAMYLFWDEGPKTGAAVGVVVSNKKVTMTVQQQVGVTVGAVVRGRITVGAVVREGITVEAVVQHTVRGNHQVSIDSGIIRYRTTFGEQTGRLD